MLRNLTAALAYVPWWIAARLGLCLSDLGNAELERLHRVRVQWIVVASGAAALFFVVANGMAAALPAGEAPGPTGLLLYVPAAVLCLAAMAVWVHSRSLLRRARLDRNLTPVPLKGRALGVIPAATGGWALLFSDPAGRWTWLSGNAQDLALMRRRLTEMGPSRLSWLTVTLTHHPRSRVIKDISGMAVEQPSAAWQRSAREVEVSGGIPEALLQKTSVGEKTLGRRVPGPPGDPVEVLFEQLELLHQHGEPGATLHCGGPVGRAGG